MAVTAPSLDKKANGFTTLNTSRLKLAIASYSLSGFAIRVVQLAKVVTHCGQPQRFGKLVVMLHQRFSKEAPELFALTINYSKLDHYARECRNRTNDIILWGPIQCRRSLATPHLDQPVAAPSSTVVTQKG